MANILCQKVFVCFQKTTMLTKVACFVALVLCVYAAPAAEPAVLGESVPLNIELVRVSGVWGGVFLPLHFSFATFFFF